MPGDPVPAGESSQDLIELYRRTRSRSTLERIAIELHTDLRAVAFRAVRRHDVAEDVVQEVFLRLLTEPLGAERIRHGRGFLRAMTLRAALGRLRRDRCQERHLAAYAHGRAASREHPDHVSQSDYFDRALAGLSSIEQAMVRLRYSSGLSNTAIAARLGCSERWVSRSLSSLLSRLRRSIGGKIAAIAAALGFAKSACADSVHARRDFERFAPRGVPNDRSIEAPRPGVRSRLVSEDSFREYIAAFAVPIARICSAAACVYVLLALIVPRMARSGPDRPSWTLPLVTDPNSSALEAEDRVGAVTESFAAVARLPRGGLAGTCLLPAVFPLAEAALPHLPMSTENWSILAPDDALRPRFLRARAAPSPLVWIRVAPSDPDLRIRGTASLRIALPSGAGPSPSNADPRATRAEILEHSALVAATPLDRDGCASFELLAPQVSADPIEVFVDVQIDGRPFELPRRIVLGRGRVAKLEVSLAPARRVLARARDTATGVELPAAWLVLEPIGAKGGSVAVITDARGEAELFPHAAIAYRVRCGRVGYRDALVRLDPATEALDLDLDPR
jgi:RNA polymerase sigma factor (sigma-70 family)